MAEALWFSGEKGDRHLQFDRADGKEEFKFDMGGVLKGPERKNEVFLAEVKKYSKASDLQSHFDRFLAQSYRACMHETPADCFLFITTSPFATTTWDSKESVESIRTAIEKAQNKRIALHEDEFDPTVASWLSQRVITVVLSDRQLEVLSLSGPELLHVQKAMLEIRAREEG